MVIVKLIGGLGNQLFQYAAGRRLAHVLQTKLKLDVTSFRYYKLRTYGLKAFEISAPFATLFDIASVRGVTDGRLLFKAAHSIYAGLCCGWNVISESGANPVNQQVLEVTGCVYLDGYWQSAKYFDDAEDIIRDEFAFKFPLSGLNKELAETISRVESVSVHVRRGDYVANPQNHSVHGVCNVNYYRECIDRISSSLSKPHFFVFSDDPTWCKDNLSFLSPVTFISHNYGKNDYEDLRLMSLCQHHIVANSSFSWWGAWLSTFSEKTVFAPAQWFRDASIDTRDLIPDSWIKISNNE